MSDKKASKKTKPKEKTADSTLYYFYSVGCGWCKRTEPIVDELNQAGYDILKLDLADKNNQELNKQLKEEYKAQCGTPWLIDASSGNQICGFREKDIIEKWAKGEEIPAPPKPNSPPPPPPKDFEDTKQVDEWKTAYEKWVKDNDHMPNLPPTDQMLQRLKQQKQMMEQKQAQQGGASPEVLGKITALEQKVDKLMKHLGVK
jgi:thiol-disulfide isomerase/thioredoxin